MDNELIRRFLSHPKRALFSWGAATVVALFTLLPAWDFYSDSSKSRRDAIGELDDLRNAVANAGTLRQRVSSLQTDGHQIMIDRETAETLREQVQHLVHRYHCQTRRLTLSDPLRRTWASEDDPFNQTAPPNAEDSSFQLERHELRLSASGSAPNLIKLIIAITKLNRFAVPTSMTVHSEQQGRHLRMDVEVSLFNITESND